MAPVQQQSPAHAPPASDTQAKFVSVVLADTEDTWTALFRAQNAEYRKPKLVLFTGATRTACGTGETASGPTGCTPDVGADSTVAAPRTVSVPGWTSAPDQTGQGRGIVAGSGPCRGRPRRGSPSGRWPGWVRPGRARTSAS